VQAQSSDSTAAFCILHSFSILNATQQWQGWSTGAGSGTHRNVHHAGSAVLLQACRVYHNLVPHLHGAWWGAQGSRGCGGK